MNALIQKLNKLNTNDVFEVVAGLMKKDPTIENEIALDAAMTALQSKVSDSEFVRLMEQF